MDYCTLCESLTCDCAMNDPYYAHNWDLTQAIIRAEMEEYEQMLDQQEEEKKIS